MYVHRMVVARDLGGRNLGAAMLDWAGRHAQRHGKPWVRLDAWRTNTALHRYYLDRGFHRVRTCELAWRGSGELFQRRAAVQLGVGADPAGRLITDGRADRRSARAAASPLVRAGSRRTSAA